MPSEALAPWPDDEEDSVDEGVCWVQYDDGSWGAVDSSGTITATAQFFAVDQLALDVTVALEAVGRPLIIDVAPESVVDEAIDD